MDSTSSSSQPQPDPQFSAPAPISQAAASVTPQKKSDNRGILWGIFGLLFLLLAAIGGYVGYILLKSDDTCMYNGVEYSDGDSFEAEDGCNSCGCDGGEVACTMMECDANDENGEEDDDSEDSEDEDVEEDDDATVVEELLPVDLYFYKGPLVPQHPIDEVFPVTRMISEDDFYVYIIGSLIEGPDQDEIDEGYVSVFSLSGESTCGGNSFEYYLAGTVMKLKFCKEIEPVLDAEDAYAGITLNAQARVLRSLSLSLAIGDVESIEVYDKDGQCYAPDSGQNECEYGDEY